MSEKTTQEEVARTMADLAELLARPFLFALGVMALTGDKLRQFIDQAVARGEISTEEGKSLLSKLSERIEEEKRNLESRISEQIRNSLQGAGLATKNDFELLRARIDALESRLARLEAQSGGEPIAGQDVKES
jgi:polyhydroxyalkanoate synthesis regulator phasin